MEDFLSFEYYFTNGGKVEIHYDSKNERFKTEFTDNVSNLDKEWWSRVVGTMNEELSEGHSPKDIYLRIKIDEDKGRTVHTKVKEKSIKHVSFLIDDINNFHFKNSKNEYVTIDYNNDIKKLVELCEHIKNKYIRMEKNSIDI